MSESASPEHGTYLMHRNRGREHFDGEEYARARRDLELAVSIRDDDPEVMYWLAMTYFRLDQHGDAESMFLRLMRFRPGHASLHVNRGISLFKLDRIDEAEIEFRRALQLDGGGNRPHLYLGLTHARRAEYEKALEHFDQAGATMLAQQMRQRLGLSGVESGRSPAAEQDVEIEIDWKEEDSPDQQQAVEAEPEPPASLSRDQEGRRCDVRVHGGSLLHLSFEGTALAHRDTLVGSAGSLRFDGLAQHAELLQVDGDGSLYLVREGSRLSAVSVQDETIHVVTERFVASQGALAREVSKSVEEGALAVQALGLRGSGVVGLSTHGRPLALQVHPGRPATLAAERVVGWRGALQVSKAVETSSADATGVPMVRFEGDGQVILDVPEGAAPAGKQPTSPGENGS
jgi:Flp pilus assembly protein TadD